MDSKYDDEQLRLLRNQLRTKKITKKEYKVLVRRHAEALSLDADLMHWDLHAKNGPMSLVLSSNSRGVCLCTSNEDILESKQQVIGHMKRAIIEVTRAINVPNMDGVLSRGSDCFIEAQLYDQQDQTIGPMVTWPVINSEVNPVWNKVRVFEQEFCAIGAYLIFTVIDEDSQLETMVRGRDVIGAITVAIDDLLRYEETGYELNLTKAAARHPAANHEPSKLFIRLVREPTSSSKTIFFVRHGESKWNQAQESMNLVNMLKEYDHGLSGDGMLQAADLARAIAEHIDEPDTIELLSATTIFCSPLTRAIQTALIGLQRHPCLQAKGLALVKDAREIKKIGGFDTVGVEYGVEKIKQRVAKEMQTLYSDEREEERLMSVAFDGGDAVNEWWTPPDHADHKHSISSRIHDLLTKMQFATDDTMVVTGHSLLWRELFKACGATRLGCEKSDRFAHCKMPNTGVVRCEFDFSKPRASAITSIGLLFKKELLHKHHKDHNEPEDAKDVPA
jgi:broad specificity phosphatase PhoE